jgi:preprotein translocase subunit SecE
MNRQTKRMQERADRASKKAGTDRKAAPQATARRAATQEKAKRTGALVFLREVRQELKKVDWPSRRELISYTVVVLATIVVLTTYVFGLDFLFSRAILNLLG